MTILMANTKYVARLVMDEGYGRKLMIVRVISAFHRKQVQEHVVEIEDRDGGLHGKSLDRVQGVAIVIHLRRLIHALTVHGRTNLIGWRAWRNA